MIKDVAVIGAGTMGHALALVHAIGGCRVRLQDNNPNQLEQAPGLMDGALNTLIEAGDIAEQEREPVLSRISTVATLQEAAAGAELIIEAIVENREIKHEVFALLDQIADANTIIASNTSYLDVFPLMPEQRWPRALIAHWYTPPYILDLVDLAPGPNTQPEVMATIKALYESFGKKPVVFDSLLPGYIANRLQAALGLEIYHLLDEGLVTAQDIDDSIIHGLSLRMATLGFCKKADFTGIDMTQRAIANKTYEPPPVREHSETIDRLMAQGRTGVMAGAGFFDYGDKPAVELFRERDIKLIKLKAALQKL